LHYLNSSSLSSGVPAPGSLKFAALFAQASLAFTIFASASTIPIPDAAFSTSATQANTLSSLIVAGNQTSPLSPTPWASELNTPAGIGLTASANITGGNAVINTPLSLGIGTSSGYIFESLTNPWQIGTYTLTTTIQSSTALMLGLLTSSGVGVGLLNNAVSSGTGLTRGTEVASSTLNQSLLSLISTGANTYSLTFQFNNTSVVGGHVGVELFSGNNSLLATGLLGGAVFGPVSLSVAPEPNPFLVIAGGLVSVVFIERMIFDRSRKERGVAKS
jgi:hypothetical protein